MSKENIESSTLVGIYNADSRPSLETFLAVEQATLEYKEKYNKEPNIIQQSSLFTLNYDKLPRTFSGYILKACCINQSIWTLANELYLLRKQSNGINKKSQNLKDLFDNTFPAYCVAHGMFANLSYFQSRGGFPTETLNEDVPFGFFTCARGDSILPIKILENSESPETIKSLINQRKVWFNPYLEFLKCRKIVIERNQYRSISELNILTLKLLNLGSFWLFQTGLLIYSMFYLLLCFNIYLFVFWLLFIIIYWYIPAVIVYLYQSKLESSNKSINYFDLFFMIILGHFNIFFNSIGPILCIIEFIKLRLFKTPIQKLKTER